LPEHPNRDRIVINLGNVLLAPSACWSGSYIAQADRGGIAKVTISGKP
jgi:hypothetical protein